MLNDDDNKQSAYLMTEYTAEQGHIQGFIINGSSAGLDVSGGGVINVRAGNALRIDLQISGSPTPTVAWLKDHSPILISDRVRRSMHV